MDTSTNINIEDESPDLNPFESCRSNGTLDFWDDPEEDIYTFEDGEDIPPEDGEKDKPD
jgi:hypothetical protein